MEPWHGCHATVFVHMSHHADFVQPPRHGCMIEQSRACILHYCDASTQDWGWHLELVRQMHDDAQVQLAGTHAAISSVHILMLLHTYCDENGKPANEVLAM